MKAKALICDESQKFTFEDVTLPDPKPDQVVLRNLYSGVSIGTELALIRNKITWGPYPLCTGYQCVGVVEEVGRDVKGVKVGDKVCGPGNPPMTRANGEKVSSVSGTHCSMLITSIDDKNAALKPEGVDDDCASMFVMPAVGILGVDMSNPRMGEVVVVYGAGLIGLGVINACALRGCVVVAVDILDNRLAVARKFGADYVINAKTQDVKEEVKKLAPKGADCVFESTGIPSLLGPTMELCKTEGVFVWQGNYGWGPFPFEFLTPHVKRLRMHFPCGDGGMFCRRAGLKNMASGALPWRECITHRVRPEDSPAFFTRINENRADDVIGAVIKWA